MNSLILCSLLCEPPNPQTLNLRTLNPQTTVRASPLTHFTIRTPSEHRSSQSAIVEFSATSWAFIFPFCAPWTVASWDCLSVLPFVNRHVWALLHVSLDSRIPLFSVWRVKWRERRVGSWLGRSDGSRHWRKTRVPLRRHHFSLGCPIRRRGTSVEVEDERRSFWVRFSEQRTTRWSSSTHCGGQCVEFVNLTTLEFVF